MSIRNLSKIRFINIRQLEISNVCELLPITFKDRIKSDKAKTLLIINYNSSPLNEDMSGFTIKTERNSTRSLFYIKEHAKSNCKIEIFLTDPKHYSGSTLPHVALIKCVGNGIITLHLYFSIETDVFSNIARGYFLYLIWANCSQLETLELINVSLIRCNLTLPVKKNS
jgi:hypothetical protein